MNYLFTISNAQLNAGICTVDVAVTDKNDMVTELIGIKDFGYGEVAAGTWKNRIIKTAITNYNAQASTTVPIGSTDIIMITGMPVFGYAGQF